jgi:hypothetical protein
LAHLSSECNTPETALSVIGNILTEQGIHLELGIAHQEKISRAFSF